MIRKHILNGLTLSLMLSLIPTPAHAGWFSSISNYFNQPSKNALVVTTAAAGISLLATFACAWNWWKKSTALATERLEHSQTKSSLSAAIADNNATKAQAKQHLSAQKQTLTGDYSNMIIAAHERNERTQAKLVEKQRLIDQQAASLKQSQEQTDKLTTELNSAWTALQETEKQLGMKAYALKVYREEEEQRKRTPAGDLSESLIVHDPSE